MGSAETYKNFSNREGGCSWPEVGTDDLSQYVPLERAASSIIRGLKGSFAIRSSRDRLDPLPCEVPLELDDFCCFLEACVAEETVYETTVDRLGLELPKATSSVDVGFVFVGGLGKIRGPEEVFSVPMTNTDPIIAGLRGWFAERVMFMATNENAHGLHEIDLTQGMPEHDQLARARIVLRVMEAAAREILEGTPPEERRAVKALGYRKTLPHRPAQYKSSSFLREF